MKRTALLLMILTWIANLQANTYDSTYIKDPYFQKLLKTNSQVPIFYNEQVRKQIGNYLKNLNNSTSILIGKTQYYQQLYGPYFDQAGIPKQLFLASAAFCNSDPLYVDPDGGSGMWSMSYAIAKKYKLNSNSYVDFRRNPDKSSKVAANYFKDLQLIYQDWLKTLVAFKTGPINMNMAIHRANNNLDYAVVHNQLSPEFQNAAVNYMAFWYIWNFYNDHKILPIKYRLPDTDTVHVEREIGLNAIAFNLNLSEELVQLCNPELRLGIVPVIYNSTGLKLPKDKIIEYRNLRAILFPAPVTTLDSSISDSLILDNSLIIPKPPVIKDSLNIETREDDDEEDKPNPVRESKTTTITYVVKKGDGLLLIADLFDCRVSDIRKWNGMKRDHIFKGQKLKIKVPKAKVTQYKKINTMTLAQKKKLAKRS
jgi:membrane-bound lytic murein transglycosylase D